MASPTHRRRFRWALFLTGALLEAVALMPTPVRGQTPPPTPEPSPSPTQEEPAPPPPPPPTPTTPEPTISTEPERQTDHNPGGGSRGGEGATMLTGRSVWKPRRDRPPEDGCAALVGGAPDLGGPRDTSRLVGILDRAATPRADGFLSVAGPFPVAGPSRWSNDWHVRRCEPYPHLHEGIDVFAPQGTPVVAVVGGRISRRVDGDISGLAIELRGENGVQYFYAHLSSIAPGIAPGDAVEAGTVLGAIGTTGNARGTSPHLHFEIQPNGIPVPPKPYLDRWLAVAERRSRALVRTLRRSSDAGGMGVVGNERMAARRELGDVSSGLPSWTGGPTGGSLARRDERVLRGRFCGGPRRARCPSVGGPVFETDGPHGPRGPGTSRGIETRARATDTDQSGPAGNETAHRDERRRPVHPGPGSVGRASHPSGLSMSYNRPLRTRRSNRARDCSRPN
jgi:hypothetical protein